MSLKSTSDSYELPDKPNQNYPLSSGEHEKCYIIPSYPVLMKALETGFLCYMEFFYNKGQKSAQMNATEYALRSILEEQDMEIISGFGKPINPYKVYSDKMIGRRLAVRLKLKETQLRESVETIYQHVEQLQRKLSVSRNRYRGEFLDRYLGYIEGVILLADEGVENLVDMLNKET